MTAATIFDLNSSNQSIKYGVKTLKKPNKLALAVQTLKQYAGFQTDASDHEEADKIEPQINSPAKQIEKAELSEQKSFKVYRKSDWINIIRNNDLENTSNMEMHASLRYGISNEL